MQCQAFLRTCRKCGKRYHKWDKSNPCECGEDRTCTRSAVEGWKWCNEHGGPSPSRGYYGHGRGLVSGTGSTVKLTRIAAKYNQMQKDGRLLSNRHSIEIVRRRIQELLERIDLNQAPDRLWKIQKLWKKYRRELEQKQDLDATITSGLIDEEFEKAYHDYMAWKQMFEALDLDRKMVESEVKVAKDIQAMLTAEDAYELMAEVFAAIMRHVKDPKTLKALQYEFARIVGDGSVIEAEEGSD